MLLKHYLGQFADLKPNRSGGRASPHKASLLLAVIDLLESGTLTANRIPFDGRLTEAFSARFEKYRNGVDRDNPANPYFYLSSSSFWHLHAVPGEEPELNERLESRKAPSAAGIKRMIRFASLDDELYRLLCDPTSRTILAAELEGTLLTHE